MSECLGGALYIEDFKRLCQRVGFIDPRQVGQLVPVSINSPDLRDLVGPTQFFSVTYRLFKSSREATKLEPTHEDYGQVAVYRGTIEGQRARMRFDNDWVFEANRPTPVDGNTAVILNESWLKRHFEVRGDRSHHFGRFVHQQVTQVQYESWEVERGGISYPVSRVPEAFATANSNNIMPIFNTSSGSSMGPAVYPPPPPPPPLNSPRDGHRNQAPRDLAPNSNHQRPQQPLSPYRHESNLTESSSFPRLNSFSISQNKMWPASAPPVRSTTTSSAATSPRFTMPINRIAPAPPPGLIPIAARPAPLAPSTPNRGNNGSVSVGGSNHSPVNPSPGILTSRHHDPKERS